MNIANSVYRTAFLPAALSTLSIIAAAQVVASDLTSTRSVTVKFGDLDISTRLGATALHRRITAAAKEACGYVGYSLVEINFWQKCVRGAVDDAVATVNSPLLTAVHGNKNVPATATAMLAK